jgi:hypothetical protein
VPASRQDGKPDEREEPDDGRGQHGENAVAVNERLKSRKIV